MAVPSFIAGLAALPQIVAGVDSVISLFGGRSAAAQGITAEQQAAISGGFGGPVTSGGTSVGPTSNPVFGDPVSANLGGAVPAIVRALPRILPAIGGGAVGSIGSTMLIPGGPTGGLLHQHRAPTTRRGFILAQARAFSPGATAKKIIRSARECGIELSAATFGLSVLDVCFLIAQPATRRARGISAADLRRTRSTLRKVANIQHDLGHLKSPIRRRSK